MVMTMPPKQSSILKLALNLLLLFIAPTVYGGDIQVSDTCSLAYAIIAANMDEAVGGCPAGDGADKITLSGYIALRATLPPVTTEITIEGNDATISGSNYFRIFAVNGGTLTVNELTMTKGKVDWGGAIVNVNGGTLTINESTISHSQAPEGGAIGNEGTLRINNSDVSNNSADIGGAIYNTDGSISLMNSSFTNNEGKEGGLIRNVNGDVKITSSALKGNEASSTGGMISSERGSITISDSDVVENWAGYGGGAIFVDCCSGKLNIINSTFTANSADRVGGAIYHVRIDLTLTNSVFQGNSASEGGAIYSTSVADAFISRSTFIDNSASVGGAIYVPNARLAFENSNISNNSAQNEGGGVYIRGEQSRITLLNVTLTDNTAEMGGGIFKDSGAEVSLTNSIISDNTGGDCYGRMRENIGSLIEDGSCFATLSGDPMLGELVEPDDGSPPYFPLLEGSPAIDAADGEYCPFTDITGTPRPQGAACDIGAYELPQ